MTLSNLCIGEIDIVSDDDGSSGSDTAMYGDDVEIVPQDADVLLGRGTKHQLHPGNLRYNGKVILKCDAAKRGILCLTHNHRCLAALLDLNRDRYIRTTSTFDKRVIIDEIVGDIVSNHGRFLKRVGNNKQWVAVSEATTRLKTAHAIQYRMRKKALTEVKPPLTDVLVSQRTSKIGLPKAAQCFARGLSKQTTTMECSDKADHHHGVFRQVRPLRPVGSVPSEPFVRSRTTRWL
jgi:hypothetical protein